MKNYHLSILLILFSIWTASGQSFIDCGNGPVRESLYKSISGISNALEFDGFEDYVAVSNGTAMIAGLSEFSMCGWVYPSNDNAAWPDFDGFFGIKDEGICDFYIAQINGTGIEARITTSTGQYTINPNEISEVEIDEWHHYALVFTGEELQIYLDGVMDGYVPASGTIDFYDKEITFGKIEYFDNDFFLEGKLDEITFWDKALTEDDLQDVLCISGDPGGIDGLVAYYDFNEESGWDLPDYFGNYDGVLIAMTGDEWVVSEVCESGFDITFTVTDEVTSLPVLGADVNLEGLVKPTDVNGVAVFNNYDPGTYSYIVTQPDYYDVIGEVEVIDQDIAENVSLPPVLYYSITFIVTEDPGSIPVDSAIVNINGLLKYTDESGSATFSGYLPGSYTYNVSKPGYFLVPGMAVVVDEDLTIEVTMTLVDVGEYQAGDAKIFPNPGTDDLYVALEDPGAAVTVQILSVSGTLLDEEEYNGRYVHFRTGNLSPGIYFLKLSTSVSTKLYKWVKK